MYQSIGHSIFLQANAAFFTVMRSGRAKHPSSALRQQPSRQATLAEGALESRRVHRLPVIISHDDPVGAERILFRDFLSASFASACPRSMVKVVTRHSEALDKGNNSQE